MKMKIKAVKYFEKGFHAQGFAFGGEDGMEHFDNNVKYRASLQNYVIDTGNDVILVDTDFPKKRPALYGMEKLTPIWADGSRTMYPRSGRLAMIPLKLRKSS